jgi:hypothetical protein
VKVKLYEENGETDVLIYAEIKENGDLVISGQDLGKAPLEVWGGIDYEYWLTVKSKNKDEVLSALIDCVGQIGKLISSATYNKDEVLLALIKQVYGGKPSIFAEFRSFMEEQGIPVEFANYV